MSLFTFLRLNLLLVFCFLLFLCQPLAAQITPPSEEQIERFRKLARQKLQELQYYDFVADFVNINLYPDIGSSVYDISDYGDSSITMIKIPFSHDFDMGKGWTPFIQCNLGLFDSTATMEDLNDRLGFDKSLQDAEVTSNWMGISLLVGGGVSIPITENLKISPSVDFAYSYFENESEFSGPGGDILYKILNGLATDWEVSTYTYIGSLQLDYQKEIYGMQLKLIEKFSYIYTQFDHEDEFLNDFHSKDSIFATRLDLEDQFKADLWGWGLGWSLFLGHYRFDLTDSKLLGVVDYYNEVGGYIVTLPEKPLLGVTGLRLGASYIFGNNITGYSIRLGFDF